MTNRILFEHIDPVWIFYVLAAAATAVFGYGLWRNIRQWLSASADRDHSKPGRGISRAIFDGLLGRAVFSHDLVAGLIHLNISWGFIILFMGTLALMVDEYLFHWLTGSAYVIYSFILEVAGLMLLAGVAAALIRRIQNLPSRLERTWIDIGLLLLLGTAAFTGFLTEASRLAVSPQSEPFSFVGQDLIGLVSGDPMAKQFLWWLHVLASLTFIAFTPYTKLSHVLAGPAQLYYQAQPVKAVDAETALEFGRSDALSLIACTHCGRCLELCPAVVSGEDFAPRDYIRGLRTSDGISTESSRLWNCSTCGACVERCPMDIDTSSLMIKDRGRVVEAGREVPPEGIDALESLHKHKNPWGVARRQKATWARKSKVPLQARLKRPVDLLYFVGCTTSVETRAVSIAQSLSELFTLAKLDFAVLGDKEPCCGDAARVWGEMGLAEMCFEETTEAVHGLADRIVTTSPHCSHTMTDRYPGLAQILEGEAIDAPVDHYSILLDELITQGRIVPGQSPYPTVTYHDPCYLGRRSGEYDAPRRVIQAMSGISLVEMERSRAQSLCCGGGGGRMVQDFEGSAKPAEIRLKEAQATGAQALVTACPICLIMFQDALKTGGLEHDLEVIDLAELVRSSL